MIYHGRKIKKITKKKQIQTLVYFGRVDLATTFFLEAKSKSLEARSLREPEAPCVFSKSRWCKSTTKFSNPRKITLNEATISRCGLIQFVAKNIKNRDISFIMLYSWKKHAWSNQFIVFKILTTKPWPQSPNFQRHVRSGKHGKRQRLQRCHFWAVAEIMVNLHLVWKSNQMKRYICV